MIQFFKINDDSIFQKWFLTNDMNHPGIINLKARGDLFISGQIFKLAKNEIKLSSLEGHPKKIKELIYSKGWHNVIGFHSRNIPHNGHIFLHKFAMKKVNADGLLISPIIGKKRKGDFANKFLKESYINLLKTKYYKDNTILSFLLIYILDTQDLERLYLLRNVEKTLDALILLSEGITVGLQIITIMKVINFFTKK